MGMGLMKPKQKQRYFDDDDDDDDDDVEKQKKKRQKKRRDFICVLKQTNTPEEHFLPYRPAYFKWFEKERTSLDRGFEGGGSINGERPISKHLLQGLLSFLMKSPDAQERIELSSFLHLENVDVDVDVDVVEVVEVVKVDILDLDKSM
ncbi:hypothetical protein DSL72_008896 [Monilinia vaccinii-corymbosi]|uniref:Uncharacterized protein n=1 Tax=Monilinia vaccinii-corymbosi TaxID=61207 RepID=A0A8A3PQI5_9HELO|nr:hypothetical protein DSL72_008896 [Monilinia vaccinii-corymbosi]